MRHKILVIALLWFLAGCSGQNSSLSEEQIAQIRSLAEPAATQLMQQLKGALTSTIEDSGMVAAINVCKSMAPEISGSVAHNFDHVEDVGRTSIKVRNVSNKPDVADISVLRFFEDQFKGGMASVPKYHIIEDGTGYRYYQPLFIQPLCLNCHGDKSTMQNEVVSAIETNYPQDKAYGYRIDDFRGLIRVKISKEQKSS